LYPPPAATATALGCFLLLRAVITAAPPLGFFVVLRSFKATAAGLVFTRIPAFFVFGYDLLTGLVRTAIL
jgi:hypothetical protein